MSSSAPGSPIAGPERVWYVAYGSNVNEARFMRYIAGDADHRGARDATPPRASVWAEAPLRLRFAGDSQRWGGGVCFVDEDAESSCFVRAWDITAEQFVDVFSQENRLSEPPVIDWSALTEGPVEVTAGWYGRIVPVALDIATADHPAFTFTWSRPLELRRAGAPYLETIAAGLAEHPALAAAAMPTEAIAAYLESAQITD